MRFPNGAPPRQRRRPRGISKIIYHADGQRVACAVVDFPRNQSARLHREFFKPRAAFGEMAQSEMQDGEGDNGCSGPATCRSHHWTFNFADCGCGALHQAAWNVDRQSSCKSPCNEKGLAGVRDNASTCQRFRGMLRSKCVGEAGAWLRDAQKSGLYAMQRFARTARRDIDAVRNAITEPWSNGQTEGQINRLKALKRAMYGRAGPELLRARLLPV